MSQIQVGDKTLHIKDFTVPEVRLRNRRKNDIAHAKRIAENIKNKKTMHKKKQNEKTFFTPEKLLNTSINRNNDKKRRNRQEKRINQKQISVTATDDLCLVIKLRNTKDANTKTKLILKDLRLKSIYQARLYKLTEDLKKKLILAGPFVVYGKPSRYTVQQLLEKKAFIMENGKRVGIDNNMIERELSGYDMLGLYDMEEVIMNLWPGFEEIQNWLAAFKLSDPHGHVEISLLHDNKLPYGDLGDGINDFVKGML